MNYLIYALLITTLTLVGLIPVVMKALDLLQLAINEKRFALLKGISQLAIHKVNQLDLLNDMEDDNKKELAILTIKEFANAFNLPAYSDTVLDGTIEAIIWSDNSSNEEDDDEDFDD